MYKKLNVRRIKWLLRITRNALLLWRTQPTQPVEHCTDISRRLHIILQALQPPRQIEDAPTHNYETKIVIARNNLRRGQLTEHLYKTEY
jgi:hypothetical protein